MSNGGWLQFDLSSVPEKYRVLGSKVLP